MCLMDKTCRAQSIGQASKFMASALRCHISQVKSKCAPFEKMTLKCLIHLQFSLACLNPLKPTLLQNTTKSERSLDNFTFFCKKNIYNRKFYINTGSIIFIKFVNSSQSCTIWSLEQDYSFKNNLECPIWLQTKFWLQCERLRVGYFSHCSQGYSHQGSRGGRLSPRHRKLGKNWIYGWNQPFGALLALWLR